MWSGLLGVREAAELLGVHANTLRRWSSRGLLKSYRVGPRGDRRFRQEDLDAFLDSLAQPVAGMNIGRRVLIVDRDDEDRRRMAGIVEAHGCVAVAVEDAVKALVEVRGKHFDMVFIELMPSDTSALDLLRALQEGNGRTVVAVIVGDGDATAALEAASVGPVFFLHRDYDARHVHKLLGTLDGAHSTN